VEAPRSKAGGHGLRGSWATFTASPSALAAVGYCVAVAAACVASKEPLVHEVMFGALCCLLAVLHFWRARSMGKEALTFVWTGFLM